MSKEKCFEIIDNLIDDGIDVLSLGTELKGNPKYSYEAIRKRFMRNFGSVRNALEEYGLFETNGLPNNLEIERCLLIDDEYKVCVNKHEMFRLMDLYNLSEIEIMKLINERKKEVQKDALDKYLFDYYPDSFKCYLHEKMGWRHLEYYTKNVYNVNFAELVNIYNIHPAVLDRWGNCSSQLKRGYVFEGIVYDVLSSLYLEVSYQQSVANCRPDFILDRSTWADAKLSSYAVFCRSCNTLDKYMKHTDSLTIIYALGDKPKTKIEGVNFKHISEYYGDLISVGKEQLVDSIENFISETLRERKAIS